MTDSRGIFDEVFGQDFKHYFGNERTDGSLNTVGYAEVQNLSDRHNPQPFKIPEGLEGYLIDSDGEDGEVLENWLIWDPKKWSLMEYESDNVIPREMLEGYHKIRETEKGKTVGLLMKYLVV